MYHIISDIQDLCIAREKSAIDFNTIKDKNFVNDANSYFEILLKLRRDILEYGTIKENFSGVEIEIKDNIIYLDFFHKDQPDVSSVSFRFCYVPDVMPEEIVEWAKSNDGKWANTGVMTIKTSFSGKHDAIAVIDNIILELSKRGLDNINEAINNIWQSEIIKELHLVEYAVDEIVKIIKEQPLDNLPLVDEMRNVNHLGEFGKIIKISLDEECPYYLVQFRDGIARWYGGWCFA